jgi:cation diffusion facilitator family transporter
MTDAAGAPVGHDDSKKGSVISIEGKKLAVGSTALNVLLSAIKFSLYLITGSSALLAETVHSLTDVVGSLLVVGGLYLSEKKSEQFPWGLYKVENVVAALLAGMIFLSSYEIAKVIYQPSPHGMRNLDITLIILFLMAVPIILFSQYEAKKAKAINFPSLMADAGHWKADVAPLIVVAVGIAGARLSYPVMDRIAAFVVIIVVIRAGFSILKDALKGLLDASVDMATLMKIKDVVAEFPQVKETVSLHARNSGRFIFVDMVLGLASKTLKDAHTIADDIEAEIKHRIPFVERVIIHYRPEKKGYQRCAVPLAEKEGKISEHFGKAPFIALWDRATDGTATAPKILGNPFLNVEKGKGIGLAEFLAGKGVDILYTKEDFKGKGPEHALAGAAIEVRKTNLDTLKEMMGSGE